jgi:hypothetical protein
VGVRPAVAMRERSRRSRESLVPPKFTPARGSTRQPSPELGEPCPGPRRRRPPLRGPVMRRDPFRSRQSGHERASLLSRRARLSNSPGVSPCRAGHHDGDLLRRRPTRGPRRTRDHRTRVARASTRSRGEWGLTRAPFACGCAWERAYVLTEAVWTSIVRSSAPAVSGTSRQHSSELSERALDHLGARLRHHAASSITRPSRAISTGPSRPS